MKCSPIALMAIFVCAAACGSNSDIVCDANSDCGSGYICRDNKCAEPECSASNPCASSDKRCDGGVCVDKTAQKAIGEACLAHSDCKSGYCNASKVCDTEPECSESAPCENISKMCQNGKCVDKKENNEQCSSHDHCKSGYCSEQNTCASKPECSASNPCAGSNQICRDGKCIDKPECDDNTPCSGDSMICRNGKCIAQSECSSTNPCADSDQMCQNGKCAAKPEECVSDSECGDGKACDNKRCVGADSCSLTRTCADGKICSNGACIDKTRTECDSQKACTDASQTCIAGKCVTCACEAGQICAPDGRCIDENVSKLKNISVGDTCTWSADYSFCDENRFFTCTKASGEENFTVKMRNCGARVCAESPTDDWNCYDPCPIEGDVYGECYDDYNSSEGTSRALSFKTQCTRTDQGLIWTFTEGYETCSAMCVNGSCVNVPSAYGSTCYKLTFTDTCQGDWSLWCEAENADAGVVAGEDCIYGYANDANDFYCAVSETTGSECVTACETEGETRQFCHDNGYGTTMSDTRKCRKTADGKLAFFLESYQTCATGCNASTGLCR